MKNLNNGFSFFNNVSKNLFFFKEKNSVSVELVDLMTLKETLDNLDKNNTSVYSRRIWNDYIMQIK